MSARDAARLLAVLTLAGLFLLALVMALAALSDWARRCPGMQCSDARAAFFFWIGALPPLSVLLLLAARRNRR